MMNKALMSVGLTGVGLLCGYWFFESRHSDTPPSPTESVTVSESSSEHDREIAALRNEMEQLRLQIASMAHKRRSTPPEPNGTDQSEPAANSVATMRGEDDWLAQQTVEEEDAKDLEEEQEAETIVQEHRQRAQRHYEQEVRDNEWAEPQEAEIQRILADGQGEHFDGLVLDYVQCRSSTCLIEVDLSRAAAPHAEMMLVGELGRILPYATSEKDGDQLKLVLSTYDIAADFPE